MFSVYQKELKLYFRTKSTYIILTILFAATGLSAILLAPMGGLQFVPVYLTPITLALLPLLQIFANRRQKRSHFEDCYFSMGISPTALTVGRFLASLTVFLLPMLEFALLPLIFSAMGSISFGSVYTSVFGYILLVALLVAMEQALLAILPNTKRCAICAYIPPVAFYAYHYLITFLPLGDIPLSLMTAINPIGLFYAFTYGRFPIADLIALAAGIFLCLFLDVLLCRHRRGDTAPPAKRRFATALASVVLVLAIALSLGAALLPERQLNPTISNSQTFEIVAETKDYLKKLDDDVTVYYLVKGGQKSADIDIRYFLYDLAELSPHLNVEIINTEKNTAFLTKYGAANLSDQSFVVVANNRKVLLDNNDLYHYYNADLQASLSPIEYTYYLSAYTSYLETNSYGSYGEQAVAVGQQLYSSTNTVAYFDGCAMLTNAIHFVTSEKVRTANLYGSQDTIDASLRSYLMSGGYYFEEIASLCDIVNNCDLLILHTPQTDITEAEADALSNYLANGGNVFLLSSCFYPDTPNLYSVTQEFGLNILDVKNIVCEQDATRIYSTQRPDYFNAYVTDFDGSFAVITAHAIKIEETKPDGVTVTPLLYTGETTGSLIVVYDNGEEDEETGEQYVCGVVAQKEKGKLLWISSPGSATSIGNTLSNGGNFTLIYETLNWMTGNTYAGISVSSTQVTTGSLALGLTGVVVFAIILALIVPLAILIPSMVYLYKRKKR